MTGELPARRLPSGSFGRVAFGLLAVSVMSGISLVPFYAAARPFESLERIEGGVPWGFFLRALHAWSSWGVLVATVLHLAEALRARTERQLSAGVWWRSVALLPLGVGALLSGFVLRGDAGAVAALAIWRRILEAVPVLGTEIARFLLGAPGDLSAAALHHAGTFTLLLWLATAEHGLRLVPDVRSAALAALASMALAGAIPVALGPPPGTASGHLLLGPWYLLGLQGALLDLPAAAGWAGPLGLVLVLGAVRHAEGRRRSALVALAALWAGLYLLFTVRILLLSRG
ncbi:MAG TPA: cytochrome b N-terminal domain-containing protein [Thermoanaerobaculia bacterium]|nr:cytochrome b N-terminal domain-containing protein [Thermoanaerobaculia bacterium]